MYSTLFLVLLSLAPRSHAATLFAGVQDQIFNASTACLTAFNTSISCDEILIQLITYPNDAVGEFSIRCQLAITFKVAPFDRMEYGYAQHAVFPILRVISFKS